MENILYIHSLIHNIIHLYGFVEVHISITHFIHKFFFSSISLDTWVLKTLLAYRASMVQIVSEWLSGLFCCSVLGIGYPTFNPSSFLKPFQGGTKESRSQETMNEIGIVGKEPLWGLSEHKPRATSRDIMWLILLVKRETKLQLLVW